MYPRRRPRIFHSQKSEGGSGRETKGPGKIIAGFRLEGKGQIDEHGKCIIYTTAKGTKYAVRKDGMVLTTPDQGRTWNEAGCTDRLLLRYFETTKATKAGEDTVYRLQGKGTFKITKEGRVLKKIERRWREATPQDASLFLSIHRLKQG